MHAACYYSCDWDHVLIFASQFANIRYYLEMQA